MNDTTRVVFRPAPDITGEQVRDARVRAWAFVFDCFHRHKKDAVSGIGSGEDDASEESVGERRRA
jgi:hypothetical protein